MPHDDVPEDQVESHQCPECPDGSVIQCDITGDWTCDTCDFWAENNPEDDDL
jgi:ribosomal protein L37AE/L43A